MKKLLFLAVLVIAACVAFASQSGPAAAKKKAKPPE